VGELSTGLPASGSGATGSVKVASGTQIAIAAFTATADQAQIIQQVLQLKQPVVFRLNPYRQNLHLVQMIWTARTSATDVEVSEQSQDKLGWSTCVADGTARACPMAEPARVYNSYYHAGCPDEPLN